MRDIGGMHRLQLEKIKNRHELSLQKIVLRKYPGTLINELLKLRKKN